MKKLFQILSLCFLILVSCTEEPEVPKTPDNPQQPNLTDTPSQDPETPPTSTKLSIHDLPDNAYDFDVKLTFPTDSTYKLSVTIESNVDFSEYQWDDNIESSITIKIGSESKVYKSNSLYSGFYESGLEGKINYGKGLFIELKIVSGEESESFYYKINHREYGHHSRVLDNFVTTGDTYSISMIEKECLNAIGQDAIFEKATFLWNGVEEGVSTVSPFKFEKLVTEEYSISSSDPTIIPVEYIIDYSSGKEHGKLVYDHSLHVFGPGTSIFSWPFLQGFTDMDKIKKGSTVEGFIKGFIGENYKDSKEEWDLILKIDDIVKVEFKGVNYDTQFPLFYNFVVDEEVGEHKIEMRTLWYDGGTIVGDESTSTTISVI